MKHILTESTKFRKMINNRRKISSGSHAIFRIILEYAGDESTSAYTAHLNLVDLAASERVSSYSGITLGEAGDSLSNARRIVDDAEVPSRLGLPESAIESGAERRSLTNLAAEAANACRTRRSMLDAYIRARPPRRAQSGESRTTTTTDAVGNVLGLLGAMRIGRVRRPEGSEMRRIRRAADVMGRLRRTAVEKHRPWIDRGGRKLRRHRN